jgi:transcriptional regulator with XRE-family HTH domain
MSNGEYLIKMGKKLKAARLKNKLSLSKVGKQCNVHLTSLWFIENGRSNVHILTLKSIADVYKMDVKEFCKFDYGKEKETK